MEGGNERNSAKQILFLRERDDGNILQIQGKTNRMRWQGPSKIYLLTQPVKVDQPACLIKRYRWPSVSAALTLSFDNYPYILRYLIFIPLKHQQSIMASSDSRKASVKKRCMSNPHSPKGVWRLDNIVWRNVFKGSTYVPVVMKGQLTWQLADHQCAPVHLYTAFVRTVINVV